MSTTRETPIGDWTVFAYRFEGEVQKIGLRARILAHTILNDIRGWIHNSKNDERLVLAVFGGDPEDVFTFNRELKIDIEELDIQMTTVDCRVDQETLPMPASRFADNSNEIGARLDKGLELLQELKKLEMLKHLEKLDEIAEVVSRSEATLNRSEKTLARIEKHVSASGD